MDLKKHIQQYKQDFDLLEVSPKMDAVFAKRLQQELHQPKKRRLLFLRYVAVAASITAFLFVGSNLYKQNIQLKQKQQILADLGNDSTGKRLEAVYNFNDEFAKEDSQIINVLINTVLHDKNANVRIATIDALLKFPQNSKVRTAFIEAIKTETEPLVQIKLINSVTILRDKRAQKPLEEIINNNETFPIVKNNATLAMANLK